MVVGKALGNFANDAKMVFLVRKSSQMQTPQAPLNAGEETWSRSNRSQVVMCANAIRLAPSARLNLTLPTYEPLGALLLLNFCIYF